MEENHPIEGLMETAMESLKAMVDVNTILGDPVETPDGNVIVPVSRVSFGFAAGEQNFKARTTVPAVNRLWRRQRRRDFVKSGSLSCGRQ